VIPAYVLIQFLEGQALSKMSVEHVKRLWDEYDGCNSPEGISGESIHLELNKRGEGAYCAV
jgi:hypothetical protein